MVTANSATLDTPPRDTSGVLVIDERIPCYCDEEVVATAGSLQGRAYLDHTRFTSTAVAGFSGFFLEGAGADETEQIEARIDSAQEVRIWGVEVPITLRGKLRGDSIVGTWSYTGAQRDIRSGAFVMKRRAPTEYTDSARVRSSRGLRRWMSPRPPSEEPADTFPASME